MNVKAEAYQEWNQAAVVDKLITGLPDVVRAMAQPLSNVDKITIVSTGNDGAAGASKLTGDMAKIAAQVPALFEAFSGMSMNELLAGVKQLKLKKPDDDGSHTKSAGVGK
jgi:flotillin